MKGLKLIGKGSFTKCYLNTCETTVTLVSRDSIKECMANGWFPDHELFPKVTLVDTLESGNSVYTMEYYPRNRGLKGHLDVDQWVIYQTLRSTMDSIRYTGNKFDSYSCVYEAFCNIEDEGLQEVMIEALNSCADYGSDVCFEISPRNVAVKDGKLVLLDCFFLKSQL